MAELTLNKGVIEICPIKINPHTGWAQDAQRIAEQGDDALVWPALAQRGRPEFAVVSVPLQTGDIWLTALDPTVGSEIQKTRPCVVISPNEMHQHLRTVIVAPMTTGSRPAAFRIPLTFQGKQGLILLDRIRRLDKQRLIQRVGAVHGATLTRTLQDLFVPARESKQEHEMCCGC